MSCHYYLYCPQCGGSSGEIGTNNPMECASFLNAIHEIHAAIEILYNSVEYFEYTCTGVRMYEGLTFYIEHEKHNKSDFKLMNEWGEVSHGTKVKMDFGFGGEYEKP